MRHAMNSKNIRLRAAGIVLLCAITLVVTGMYIKSTAAQDTPTIEEQNMELIRRMFDALW